MLIELVGADDAVGVGMPPKLDESRHVSILASQQEVTIHFVRSEGARSIGVTHLG
jgi:hypothetical protein